MKLLITDREELSILPISLSTEDMIVNVSVNLIKYREAKTESNIYFRFWIKPSKPNISIRKNGISKSTIIYDIKVNEKRNMPDNLLKLFNDNDLCSINSCFSFNILPNKYEIVFFDNSSLKNVRTLEYDSFNRYLDDRRVQKDELIVVFNKKQNHDSYSFFSLYSKERIGNGQFALAILINIFCGIILTMPNYRKSGATELNHLSIWSNLPLELYVAFGIMLATLIYFVWPKIKNIL